MIKTVWNILELRDELEAGDSAWYRGKLAPNGVQVDAVPALVGRCSLGIAKRLLNDAIICNRHSLT